MIKIRGELSTLFLFRVLMIRELVPGYRLVTIVVLNLEKKKDSGLLRENQLYEIYCTEKVNF